MELDDLKSAWQSFDGRLERQFALNLHVFNERGLERVRSSLRPLLVGQFLQLMFGVVVVTWAGAFWTAHRDVLHLLAMGLVMHAYGIVTIVCAGVTLATMRGVDYAAPVVEIQHRLARLRRRYVMSGLIAGLPWWLLWMPATLMLVADASGVDPYALLAERAPSLIWANLAVGVAGLLGCAWLYRWTRDPRRARAAQWLSDLFTGASLRRAQHALDDVARFASE